ncbi:MAG: TonB family protein [Candidatus Methylomirabilales bacterium]
MGYLSEMDWEGREFAINVVFSLVLHFLVFAGIFLTPSLYSQRFHVPVAYEVNLVELPGTRRVTPSRKRKPAVKRRSPGTSPQVAPSRSAPKTTASAVKPKASPEAMALPGKRKMAKSQSQESRTRSVVPPRPIAQAAVPVVVPARPRDRGRAGVVSESSVSADKADPSLSYYLAAIQAKVSSRWIEPSLSLQQGEVERVTLGFTVLRSGLVRDIHVLAPSGNVFLNQSALRAVQEAVPLPPFPPLFREETLIVRFHFEMRGE